MLEYNTTEILAGWWNCRLGATYSLWVYALGPVARVLFIWVGDTGANKSGQQHMFNRTVNAGNILLRSDHQIFLTSPLSTYCL